MNQLQGITVFFDSVLAYDFWEYSFFGNTVQAYGVAFFAFIAFLALFKLFQVLILKKLHNLAEKTATDIDDTLIEIVRSLKPPFYSFLAIYVALQFLALSETLMKVLTVLLIMWVVYQGVAALLILIDYIAKRTLNTEEDPSTQGAISMVKNIVKGIVWGAGLMVILSNVGVDITALIAGLGIGGIAVAFAFQNILEDLFSSFAILFDKPFQIGDFIVVGDKKGTVQKIGIKTTRIQSVHGEEIVISNKELTSAQVQNFKKMEERRIAFSVGATYETKTESLKKIPLMIKEIIENKEGVRFDRSHFKSFDDSALTFETVYYVLSAEYEQYMDVQQSVNFDIREAFEREEIEMAYPTQTLYVKK